MLEKVKKFVNESFKQCVSGKSTKHFERTVYWVKQLKTDADEPILIAAYAHDIARAFRKKSPIELFKKKEINDKEILKKHQEEGAKVMIEFLKKEDYDKESTKRVSDMIRHHEEGRDEESNLVKDADSISYLEVNAPKHIKLIKILGKGKIKRKVDWMFNRISSKKAKLLAKPYYEKVVSLLSKS